MWPPGIHLFLLLTVPDLADISSWLHSLLWECSDLQVGNKHHQVNSRGRGLSEHPCD